MCHPSDHYHYQDPLPWEDLVDGNFPSSSFWCAARFRFLASGSIKLSSFFFSSHLVTSCNCSHLVTASSFRSFSKPLRLYGISANKSTESWLHVHWVHSNLVWTGCIMLYHYITISGRHSSACILTGSLLLDAGDPCFQSGHLDGAGHFSNRHLRLDKTSRDGTKEHTRTQISWQFYTILDISWLWFDVRFKIWTFVEKMFEVYFLFPWKAWWCSCWPAPSCWKWTNLWRT